MNRRRTLIPMALLGSVAIALAPTLARASTSSPSAARQPASGHSLGSVVAAGSTRYSVPASKSVLSRKAGASGTTPNPDLAVALTATSAGAYGVTVEGTVTGLTSGTATVNIDCGVGGTGGGRNVPVDASDGFTAPCEYGELGQSNQISVSASDEAGDLATNTLSGVHTAGAYFGDYGPQRILDTRTGLGTKAGPVAAGGTLKLKVTGLGSIGGPIPAGITAVALNVTAVTPAAGGYLSVYGNEDQSGAQLAYPGTSNINFRSGGTVAELVIAPVGKDGTVDFYNGSAGSLQLVADVAGIFTPNPAALTNVSLGGYTPITPTRFLDTRDGTGTGGKIARIPANGTVRVQMSGVDGLAALTASVAMNITVTNAAAGGVIAAYPANNPTEVPEVSNVNYSAGQTTSNMAIVTTSLIAPAGSPTGSVAFHNSSSVPVDLIVDVVGYFGTSAAPGGPGAYVPFSSPVRVRDTRQNGGPLPSGEPIDLTGTAHAYETADVFNATVTQPTAGGYLSVYPFDPDDPEAVPTTSNLNYRTGQTTPSPVIASPGTVQNTKTGTYDFGLYLGGTGTAQLVLDQFGYFADE